ncbi:Helix-turn-helix domain protein [Eubacteriaceae bacterium CHKCI004]|nr:Helix-turn-helix domain protein [Eubacteriaceae bacterium CHKCI004]
MYEKEFSQRLAQLRLQKGISARDMSLSIGQNPGYINTIENGKSFPTMTNFFYICEYLNITPEEFFDMSSDNPETLKELIENIKLLNSSQLDAVTMIVNELLKK